MERTWFVSYDVTARSIVLQYGGDDEHQIDPEEALALRDDLLAAVVAENEHGALRDIPPARGAGEVVRSCSAENADSGQRTDGAHVDDVLRHLATSDWEVALWREDGYTYGHVDVADRKRLVWLILDQSHFGATAENDGSVQP